MGTKEQKFCVRARKHPKFFERVFDEFLKEETFCDVTLTNTNFIFKAHKLVLSVCSPYFKKILKDAPLEQHIIIILKDVTSEEASCFLEYMYTGETTVPRTLLSKFLETCRSLEIEGFTSVNESSDDTVLSDHSGRPITRESSLDVTLSNNNDVDLNSSPEPESYHDTNTNSRNNSKKRRKKSKGLKPKQQKLDDKNDLISVEIPELAGSISDNDNLHENRSNIQAELDILDSPPRPPSSIYFSVGEPDNDISTRSKESLIRLNQHDHDDHKTNSPIASTRGNAAQQSEFLKSLNLISKSSEDTNDGSDESEVIVRKICRTRSSRIFSCRNISKATFAHQPVPDVQTRPERQLRVILSRFQGSPSASKSNMNI
ncbi:longitudinals lacking protein, isoforms H/M/V-like isoform X2 [Euwallacea similis]|uniref:longitudinals lacking protein, isoforms H/M/V-like isoform X2 n=1 Tax=Euwallacea similis TaxID=1736056 RepID=UPI00344F43E2